MSKKRIIPNPNSISDNEKNFVNKKEEQVISSNGLNIKDNYKGRMISMSDSFYKKLNDYLKKHPTEGNRSSFIVRVVADYIEKKI